MSIKNIPALPGIYSFLNVKSGDRYIGQSVAMLARVEGHIRRLRERRHPNKTWQKIVNRLGIRSFVAEVLAVMPSCINVHTPRGYSWLNGYETFFYLTLKPSLNAMPPPSPCDKEGLELYEDNPKKYWEWRKQKINMPWKGCSWEALFAPNYEDIGEDGPLQEKTKGLLWDAVSSDMNNHAKEIIEEAMAKMDNVTRAVLENRWGISGQVKCARVFGQEAGISMHKVFKLERQGFIRLRELITRRLRK